LLQELLICICRFTQWCERGLYCGANVLTDRGLRVVTECSIDVFVRSIGRHLTVAATERCDKTIRKSDRSADNTCSNFRYPGERSIADTLSYTPRS
jgi:hypothetical protein